MDSLFRIAGMFLIGYSALLLWIYLSQQQMLYFPDQFRPSAEQAKAENLQLWPGPGNQYRGLLHNPEKATATAIVFHGNAGSARDRRFYAEALGRLNYRVILVEYPGYGGRPGKASEPAILEDADKAIALIRDQFPGPVTLWGESLGAAAAAASTKALSGESQTEKISAVVMITPWYSLPELAQSLYWYLPAKWLTREQHHNHQNLTGFDGKTAILIADSDEIIPNQQSLKLYDSLTTPKQLWLFEGANHNSWPIKPDAAWWAEVDRFIRATE